MSKKVKFIKYRTEDEILRELYKLEDDVKFKEHDQVADQGLKLHPTSMWLLMRRIWSSNYYYNISASVKDTDTKHVGISSNLYDKFESALINKLISHSYKSYTFWRNRPSSRLRRPLKVGFVSGDFLDHVVMNFFSSIIPNLTLEQSMDPCTDSKDNLSKNIPNSKMEIFLYSNIIDKEDEWDTDNKTESRTVGKTKIETKIKTEIKICQVTKNLQNNKFIQWRDIHSLTIPKACELIRDDGIDILVDLSGHSAGNRMGLFALSPAPIQVSWLGYPNTTGLKTIQYRLTDKIADPPGTLQYFSEKLVYMENDSCFLCWNSQFRKDKDFPTTHQTRDINFPPSVENKFITFGCFNNVCKFSLETIQCWGRVLKAVENSKLMIKINLGKMSSPGVIRLLKSLSSQGIEGDRLIIAEECPSLREYFQLYSQIDIALDCFPYSGTTTTCDTLSMGVPLITMKTSTPETHIHSHNVSASILARIPSVSDLVSDSVDGFILKAKMLALNSRRLIELRRNLCRDFWNSDACDKEKFKNNLIQTFEKLWKSHK